MKLVKGRDFETCEACPVYQSGGWIHEGGYNVLIQPQCVANLAACNPSVALDLRPAITEMLLKGKQLALVKDEEYPNA